MVLLVASLFSWTVILGKWSSFSRATKQNRRFIRAFRKASRLQADFVAAAARVPCQPVGDGL